MFFYGKNSKINIMYFSKKHLQINIILFHWKYFGFESTLCVFKVFPKEKLWETHDIFQRVFPENALYIFPLNKHIGNSIIYFLKSFSFRKTHGCQECESEIGDKSESEIKVSQR